jgi:hypothetical protein
VTGTHHLFVRRVLLFDSSRAQIAQRLAFDKLHHDIELAVGLTNFVDGANVGMIKRRRSPRFVQQTLAS